VFSATVVADAEDQDPLTLEHNELRRIPTLYTEEQQLPSGAGEDPPSQPSLEGLEPDLPSLTEHGELERRGQQQLEGEQWMNSRTTASR
jgi:hypothetical protein